MSATIAPYGTWTSPITSDVVVRDAIGLSDPRIDGDDLYWIELRPSERGRLVLVRQRGDGRCDDVLAPPWSARTRVHEYGGGAFLASEATVYFSNDADQRVYCLEPGGQPVPVTAARGLRFADATHDVRRRRLILVREDHRIEGREPVNSLVAVETGNAGRAGDGEGVPIAGGHDFYAAPRLSPDGSRLAFLRWNHPAMPWDATELCVATLEADGSVGSVEVVAGGPAESVLQPRWSPGGVLHCLSDRTGWWNLYRLASGGLEALCPRAADFSGPPWLLGQATYGFASESMVLCAARETGSTRLGWLDTGDGTLRHLDLPYTEIDQVRVGGRSAVFIASAPDRPAELVRIALDSSEPTVLRSTATSPLDNRLISRPELITFPGCDGRQTFAFHYPPHNPGYEPPPGERPPLIVRCHGGPTSAASTGLNPGYQFWTSRGFAIVDVDYGGSSGYGRAYRERLRLRWGVVDVEDVVAAARALVDQGKADPKRLVIMGGSAGGFTVLAALTFRDAFSAGASLYGVSDLEALARDTHKFEARYLDGLIGPWPEARAVYEARSPIRHVDGLSCPVIFFQGAEDAIVPPAQSERMVDALQRKGIPVEYELYGGEQHGFRQAATIKRTLDASLDFFRRVLRDGAPASDRPS